MDKEIESRWQSLHDLESKITDMTVIGARKDAKALRLMILDYLRYHGWTVSGKTSLYMLTMLLFKQAARSERYVISAEISRSLKGNDGHLKD